MTAASKADAGKGRFAGTLLMGLAFTLTSFTCTAPFLGSLLVLASQGDWQWPLAGMLAFSGVFALPFVILALVPQALKSLPRSGPWLIAVKAVMGLIEIAAAMKFLSNVDLVWNWNVFTRSVVIGLVQASRALGEVRGQAGGQLVMVGIPVTDAVVEGDTVVSAGIGIGDVPSRYPAGLLIGTVQAVEDDANALTRSLPGRAEAWDHADSGCFGGVPALRFRGPGRPVLSTSMTMRYPSAATGVAVVVVGSPERRMDYMRAP